MDRIFCSTFMKENPVIFSDRCNANVSIRMVKCEKENTMGFFLALFSFAFFFFLLELL